MCDLAYVLLLDEAQATAADLRAAALLAAAFGAQVDPPPSRAEVRQALDDWLTRSSTSEAAPDDDRTRLLRALGLR